MRALTRIFPVLLVLTAQAAAAVDLADPLATDALLPLRQASALAARVGAVPCADSLPEAPLTAQDAVDLALCRHPQTRELWANARAQAAQVGVARAAWLPTLDARASTARNFNEDSRFTSSSAALDFSWLLFDAGRRSAAEENASQLLEVALATRDASVQALFLAALQGYYGAQAAQAAVQATLDSETAARASLEAAELRYKVGVATPADRLQAQTALSQARLARQRAAGEARNALGGLANALGFPAQTPLQLALPAEVGETAAFRDEVEALIGRAVERRPDLKAAEAQVRAAAAAVDAARAQGWPTLGLSAGPDWQRLAGTTTHGGSIGLTLNVPLFSGFDTTYRVRAAEAQQEARAAQRDRLRNQVSLDVWQAYQNLATATETLQTTRDLLASAEQADRVARGRYRAGVGNLLDLLNAQSALADARVQRIRAELDWNIYRATLAQAMGALDDTLLRAAEERR